MEKLSLYRTYKLLPYLTSILLALFIYPDIIAIDTEMPIIDRITVLLAALGQVEYYMFRQYKLNALLLMYLPLAVMLYMSPLFLDYIIPFSYSNEYIWELPVRGAAIFVTGAKGSEPFTLLFVSLINLLAIWLLVRLFSRRK